MVVEEKKGEWDNTIKPTINRGTYREKEAIALYLMSGQLKNIEGGRWSEKRQK